ncbi:homoserine dehydrogenase [Arthrobacter psychrolactophilus]|uniref:Homoserine dehydrogenase n=1 Tax=Arthrobacter psychrolactophilus TaxID=92442 RepID=A0A2V5JDN5_9MICC|nr:homoserine dehydrogenase [Arthrobacter psychrolactophilus]
MLAGNGSPTSQPLPLVLSGFGPVAQEFLARIRATHSQDFFVAGIRGHQDQILLDPDSAVPARPLWTPLTPITEFLSATGAVALIQATPSSSGAHPRAVEESLTALRQGIHVVTATKSHLLTHWQELAAAAQEGGSRIRISGATGAALPAADLARLGVQGLGCESLRACPNGTSTFVLDRISAGSSLVEAIAEAQRLGIAESDPSADLSGSDTATKARLLAGLLWGWDVSQIRVEQEGIDDDSLRRIIAELGAGQRLRAVATASLKQPLHVSVRIEALEPSDPLFHLSGPEKAITFQCPEAGDITVQGGRSSPAGAALSMVKDVLTLLRPQTTGFH